MGVRCKLLGPSADCMGISADATPVSDAVEVLWMPCNGQSNQRWVIESLGRQNEREWLRIRPSYDMGRCLQYQQDGPLEGAQLIASPCHGVWMQQWNLE